MPSRLLLFTFFLQVRESTSQNCASAPTEAIRNICNQISNWDNNARSQPAPAPAPASGPFGGALAALGPPQSEFDCTTISCICGFLGGTGRENCVLSNGQPYQKVQRKEFRVMTDNERQRYVNAMWTALSNGGYRVLSSIHSSVQRSPGAHSGPAFLPWHREFLKRMEITLRRIDPTVALPYWDSTLDNRLPNPRDSVMWHSDLMGYESSDGQVRSGLFANWPFADNSRYFRRQRGNGGAMFTPFDIATVMAQTDPTQVLANTAPRQDCPNSAAWSAFEYAHGNPHLWVGGDMLVIITSTNDPLFFNHHSMVDKVWEDWRLARQTRAARTTAYPEDDARCHSQAHFANNVMQPFTQFVNRDGLSNDYTDSLYSYAPSPRCAANNINGCGSRFLFCDLSHGVAGCAPKIVLGGNCNGFINNEDSCYQGVCSGGVCVARTTTNPPQTSCLNSHYCCPVYAQNNCNVPSWRNYMTEVCGASCGFCQGPVQLNGPQCVNFSPSCSAWAASGYCSSYSTYMWENCKVSCNACVFVNVNSRVRYCSGSSALSRAGSAGEPPKMTLIMDRGVSKKHPEKKTGISRKKLGWARMM